MTDIVERLSQWAENDMRAEDVALAAKHEIERLRAERDEWRQAAGAEASERRRAHEEIEQLKKEHNLIRDKIPEMFLQKYRGCEIKTHDAVYKMNVTLRLLCNMKND